MKKLAIKAIGPEEIKQRLYDNFMEEYRESERACNEMH
jgi:hypothetical protein